MSKTRQVFPTNLKRKNVWILWVFGRERIFLQFLNAVVNGVKKQELNFP